MLIFNHSLRTSSLRAIRGLLSTGAGQYRLSCQAGDCQSRGACYIHSNSSIRHSVSSSVISRVQTRSHPPGSQPYTKDANSVSTPLLNTHPGEERTLSEQPELVRLTWMSSSPAFLPFGNTTFSSLGQNDLRSSNLVVASFYLDETRRVEFSGHSVRIRNFSRLQVRCGLSARSLRHLS